MEDSVSHSNASSFADDTRLCKSISTSEDCKYLQSDLNDIIQWSKSNNMQLHEHKFVYMNYNARPKHFTLANLPFYGDSFKYDISDNACLEVSELVNDLGVTFSSNMDWSSHILNIAKAAKRKAGWALSVFKDRSPFVMLTLYKSLIRSKLEYACPLWTGMSLENCRLLEAIQRSFTNKINCPSGVNDYWERLAYLNMMSLQRRRERYVIIHMFKILNFTVCNDVGISFHDHPRLGLLADLPSLRMHSSLKAKTLFDSSFSVLGPKLWNRVPRRVKESQTLISFKTKLDEYLKTIPDQPPVQGYVCQNNNSLIDWCPGSAS